MGTTKRLPVPNFHFFIFARLLLIGRLIGDGLALNGAAAVLYQEPHGDLWPPPYQGSEVGWGQTLGLRFAFNQPVHIQSLHMVLGDSPWSFFAALVSIPSVTSFPQGGPLLDSEVIHSEVFNLTWDVVPVTIPFDVTVPPGAYALVFGGGLFGSHDYISAVAAMYQSVEGSTGMAFVDPDAPYWHDTPGLTWDLSVEGTVVPEPRCESFLALVFLILFRFRSKTPQGFLGLSSSRICALAETYNKSLGSERKSQS